MLTTPDGDIERSDPRARSLTNSVGTSIVVDDNFDWATNDVGPVALNELVIYELHPKTFAGTLDDVADQLGHIGATKYANIWSTTRSESAHLVVVTLNEHDATTSVDVTGDWHCVLDTPSVDYHHTGTDAMPAIQTHESSSSITLPANGAAIFVR